MITLCFATYALNRFLSPARNCVSLRTRGHSYQLSEYSTDPHKNFFLSVLYIALSSKVVLGFFCFALYAIVTAFTFII